MFKNFLLAFFLFLGISSNAQNNVNNIYSYHHLGLFEPNENAFQLGMGGVKYGLVDSAYANGSNPAVMSYLAKGQPVFGVDVTGRVSFFESSDGSANTRAAYLRSINFSIPFANKLGLGFGYRPVFSKGYRFNEFQYIQGDSLNRVYQGTDGVQQAYLAFSIAPIKSKKTFFSLGFEGNFNFGNPTNVRAVEFVNFSTSNAANILNDTIRGFGFKTSLAFKHEISEFLSFSFGTSYSFSGSWKTTYTDRIVGYAGNYGINHQVTQQINNVQSSGTITTPTILGIGLGFDIHPQGFSLNTKRQSKIRIQADYESIDWQSYGRTLQGVADPSFTYQNTTAFRVGVEFTPHRIATDRSPGLGYMNKISYRLGLNLNEIALPNQILSDRGITFGMGLPIPFDNSQSSINIGIRAGNVGAIGTNSISENYIAYQIGIVLTPGKWERWFRKIKYD
jgi:hypothetical protein